MNQEAKNLLLMTTKYKEGVKDTFEHIKMILSINKNINIEAQEKIFLRIINKSEDDILREIHARQYKGTDDDMPDDFDNWIKEEHEEPNEDENVNFRGER